MYDFLFLTVHPSISDAPEAPGKPNADEVDRGFVRLSWEAPEADGGSPIIGYVVEKRERDGEWIPVRCDRWRRGRDDKGDEGGIVKIRCYHRRHR